MLIRSILVAPDEAFLWPDRYHTPTTCLAPISMTSKAVTNSTGEMKYPIAIPTYICFHPWNLAWRSKSAGRWSTLWSVSLCSLRHVTTPAWNWQAGAELTHKCLGEKTRRSYFKREFLTCREHSRFNSLIVRHARSLTSYKLQPVLTFCASAWSIVPYMKRVSKDMDVIPWSNVKHIIFTITKIFSHS